MAKRKMMSREEMLNRVRQKMQERAQTRRDPDEFRCPTAKEGQTLEYYFKILPELNKGDQYSGGVCKADSDLWYYENGSHFINRTRIECPRYHDKGECLICQLGFDLMQDSEDKDYRSKIAKVYLSRGFYAVNIYFLNHKRNPDDLRGKVKWYNAPRTIYDKWDACVHSDDAGDKEEPRACGIFYHPWDGCYTFKLEATKRGDYNNYEASAFLPNTFGPLVKLSDGSPDDEAIEAILSQRILLPEKFPKRDKKKLEEGLKWLLNKDGTKTDDTEEIVVDKPEAKKDDVVEDVDEVTKPAPEEIEEEPSKPAKKKEIEEVIEEESPRKNKEKPEEVIEDVVEEEKPKQKSKAKPKEDEVNDEDLRALLNTLEDEE